MGYVIWIILAIASIFISVSLAKKKNRSVAGWVVLALFIGIFAPIILALLPTVGESEAVAGISKKCPKCAEIIKGEAEVCRFCGHKFDKRKDIGESIEKRQIQQKQNSSEKICPTCNKPMQNNWKTCPHDGTPLVLQEKEGFCPACQIQNPPDAKFCVDCGLRLGEDETGKEDSLRKQILENKSWRDSKNRIICPRCKGPQAAEELQDGLYCISCGAYLPDCLEKK